LSEISDFIGDFGEIGRVIPVFGILLNLFGVIRKRRRGSEDVESWGF
jgi:hypothetical protein